MNTYPIETREQVIAKLGYTRPGFKWDEIDPRVRVTRYRQGVVVEVLEATIEVAERYTSGRAKSVWKRRETGNAQSLGDLPLDEKKNHADEGAAFKPADDGRSDG